MTSSDVAFPAAGPCPLGPDRRSLLALLCVLVGIPLGFWAHHCSRTIDQDAFEAHGLITSNVHVALHLDETLAPDRTVVWTAAFQAAWDRLTDTLGSPDGLSLDAPAQPAAVRALNTGRLAGGVVDPRDVTVIVGPATEATWGAIGQVSSRTRPSTAPTPSSQDLVAYARLTASARYEVPFFVREQPLHFGAQRVPVKAWGLRKNAGGRVAERMREQVRVHVPEGDPEQDAGRTGVVVITASEGRRVVVSGRPPRATLRQTWQDVAAVIASAPPQKLSRVTRLSIPRVAIVAGRSFEEIAPARVTDRDAELVLARQDVRLLVDERGAEVDAEAVVVLVAAIPREIDIDGPFLVALLAPGSDRPFALAWVGCEDGLTPWGAVVGQPLSAGEALAFVGTWALDRAASADATFDAFRQVLGREGGERQRVTREHVAGFFENRSFAVEVSRDGTVRIQTASDESADARLTRDGSRFLLHAPTADGSGRDEWEISHDQSILRLHARARGEVLLLRRE